MTNSTNNSLSYCHGGTFARFIKHIHMGHIKAVQDQLALVNNIDEYDDCTHGTALHLSIKLGNKKIARLLLAQGADPRLTTQDSEQATALHLACKLGSISLIELIISKMRDNNSGAASTTGGNSTTNTHNGSSNSSTSSTSTGSSFPMSAIHMLFKYHPFKCRKHIKSNNFFVNVMNTAIAKGNLEVMQDLATCGMDMNKLSARGFAALHLCAIHNKPEIARFLLEKRLANPNVKNSNDEVPLHYCSVYNTTAVAKVLLEFGADVHATTRDEGNTALILSVDRRFSELTDLLYRSGSNLNHINKKQHTPLIYAVCGKNFEMTKFLVERGANIHYCGIYPVIVEAAGSGEQDIVKYLISKGANVDQDSPIHGITALMNASHRGHIDIARILINCKCSLHNLSKYKDNALNLAAESGSTELVRLLVEQGVSYNNISANGNYPLMIAARDNHASMVAYLLTLPHIKIDIRNDDCTPLLIAAFKSNWDIVKLLVQKGANVNERNRISKSILDFLVTKNEDQLADILHLFMNNGFNCTNCELTGAAARSISTEFGSLLQECKPIRVFCKPVNMAIAASNIVVPTATTDQDQQQQQQATNNAGATTTTTTPAAMNTANTTNNNVQTPPPPTNFGYTTQQPFVANHHHGFNQPSSTSSAGQAHYQQSTSVSSLLASSASSLNFMNSISDHDETYFVSSNYSNKRHSGSGVASQNSGRWFNLLAASSANVVNFAHALMQVKPMWTIEYGGTVIPASYFQQQQQATPTSALVSSTFASSATSARSTTAAPAVYTAASSSSSSSASSPMQVVDDAPSTYTNVSNYQQQQIMARSGVSAIPRSHVYPPFLQQQQQQQQQRNNNYYFNNNSYAPVPAPMPVERYYLLTEKSDLAQVNNKKLRLVAPSLFMYKKIAQKPRQNYLDVTLVFAK